MEQNDDKFEFRIESLPEGEHQRAVTAGEAEEFLLKRLETEEEKHAEILENLLQLYIRTIQPDKATACARRLMDLAASPEERGAVCLRMGCLAEQMNDFVTAEGCYRDALSGGAPSPTVEYWACNNLGYSLNQLGRPAEAEPYLQRAIALDPSRSNAFKNLGLCYQGLERFADAAKRFVEATRVNATDGRSLAHLEELVGNHPELYGQVPGLADSLEKCRAAVEIARMAQPDFDRWWRERRAEQHRRNEAESSGAASGEPVRDQGPQAARRASPARPPVKIFGHAGHGIALTSRHAAAVLGCGGMLIVVLVLMPPWFGVDSYSGGEAHASIGHHFIWSKPTPAMVYERLTSERAAVIDPARLAAFQAHLNVVRLVVDVLVVVLVSAISALAIRRFAAQS